MDHIHFKCGAGVKAGCMARVIPVWTAAGTGQVSAFWQRWRYTGGKRDLRLDLLRGFAMFAMVVNHIGGETSWLYSITGGNRFFISAAEIFVFISGLVMGIIYFDVIARYGIRAALAKALRRTWTLYLLTVSLSLIVAVMAMSLPVDWALYLTPTPWPSLVVGLIDLRQTYMFTDVLLLYTLLILVAGPLLALMARGYTAVVLLLSWGLWAVWQVAPSAVALPWHIIDNELFHFSAWQVLFVTALVIGYHRRTLEARLTRVNVALVCLASGVLLIGFVFLYTTNLAPLSEVSDVTTLNAVMFDKTQVRVGRLVVFADVMIFAYTLLTLAWAPLSRATAWLLMPLGQHSLSAYTLHFFVMALLAVTVYPLGTDWGAAGNALVQWAGILLLWLAVHAETRVRARLNQNMRRPLPTG